MIIIIREGKNMVKIDWQKKANLDPRVNVKQIRIWKKRKEGDQTYNQRRGVLGNLREHRDPR